MILFFDTETTGFFDDRLPIDHEAQPYIVQLAAQLCEADGSPVAGFCFVVDPGISNGVRIPERAAAVHGITEDKAVQFGMSAEFALSAFTHLYQRADLICAHNIKFDKGVIEVAIARHYGKTMPLRKPLFCTMEAASPIIKLPPTDKMRAAGFDKPKPPKLEECIRHFFNEELDGAHDAMVDLTACRRVYLHLKSIESAA
ncbi:MAG TPA: 3'-5' exonuclease [Gemmatimonadaceae bacterium]|nr:3'-5' exonuclease [Gemmatimonadaceae bacterium]